MDNNCESPSSLQLAMKKSGIFRKVLSLPSYEEVGQNSPSFATPGSPKVSKRLSRDSMDFLKNPMMFYSEENLEASDSTKRRRSSCALDRRLTICILVLVCLLIIGIVVAIVSTEIFHPRGYFPSANVGSSLTPQQISVSRSSEQQEISVEDSVSTTLLPSTNPNTVERVAAFPPTIATNPLFSNGGPQSNLQNALSFQGPLQLFGR